ncbi:TPA: hypothetical protein N0F65_003201 [Lagenidium giganteum]|uniref:Uncharacterized protein n=1 Tax=Lagenidium giganteum TaxID=4803 RepID=A0AAV2Z6J3_9STRA|nr:TPA: hypothetical protein N0F65_003201 [Lagenidium giganteum]
MPSLFDSHRSLIGRAVRVHLVDGSFAVGFLYAIDPETDHVAIVRHCKGAGLAASGPSVASFMDVQVIMGHCVKQVDGDDHSECLDEAEAIAEALGSREMEKPCDSPCTRGRGPQEDVQQLRNKFNAFLDQVCAPALHQCLHQVVWKWWCDVL